MLFALRAFRLVNCLNCVTKCCSFVNCCFANFSILVVVAERISKVLYIQISETGKTFIIFTSSFCTFSLASLYVCLMLL